MAREEFYYDSGDKKHKIRALKWVPDGEIRYVVQLVHGMAEHIERYDDFACFLNSQGILVVGNDHLGHGKSVNSKDEWGYFCKKDALNTVLGDMYKLTELTKQEYPDKKYFIFGHSMGSLLLRNYLFSYSDKVDGAVLCGTASQSPIMTVPGLIILNIMKLFKGDRCRTMAASKLCNGNYNARIKDPKTPHDWLSTDTENVKRFMEDEACGFLFTLNGFITLVKSVDNLNKKKYLANMVKTLPILLVSGSEDPVGNYGEGVKRAYGQLVNAGMINTKMKLYPNLRHEILNEVGKEKVYEDIYAFFENN